MMQMYRKELFFLSNANTDEDSSALDCTRTERQEFSIMRLLVGTLTFYNNKTKIIFCFTHKKNHFLFCCTNSEPIALNKRECKLVTCEADTRARTV